MPLLVALALVIMFASTDAPPLWSASAAGRLGAALLVMLVPTALAWTSAARIAVGVRSGRLDDRAAATRLRWASRLHLVVWCTSVAVLALVVGWSHLVRIDWGLDAWPCVAEWMMFVPIVVPIVGGWMAFYEVERALDWRDMRLARRRSRWRYVGEHLRGQLLLLLLPVVAIVSVADLARWWNIPLEGGAASGAIGVAVVGLLALCYPWLLRVCWRARRLPEGPLRDRLEAVLTDWRLDVNDILVWPTDDRMANAAVAGLMPQLRYVFLTDALVRNFSAGEVEAVLAHEMGHLRYRHLFLRLMAMFVPLAVWPLLAAAGLTAPPDAGAARAVAALGAIAPEGAAMTSASWLPGVVVASLLIAYMATVWAGYSRLLESQADLFACEYIPPEGGGLDEEQTPIDRFVAVLEKLAISNGIEPGEHQWQHGSVRRRAEFLRRVAGDDARARRFDNRLARLATAVVALGAVGAMCCVV